MRFEWDKAKRKSNLKAHGLDFADAEFVFGGLTTLYEDERFRYKEQRFVSLGLLRGVPVSHRPHRVARRHSHHFFSSGNTP